MKLKTFGIFMAAYCVMALLLFGDIFAPINLVYLFPGSFGDKYWLLAPFIAALIALSISSTNVFPHLWPELRPALFMVSWMLLSVLPIGFYADWRRRDAIDKFHADVEFQHSFFHSIREIPEEFQFYVHAAALKDCTPYIWSYGGMSLFKLDPNVAVNVLPTDWIARCNIKRTH